MDLLGEFLMVNFSPQLTTLPLRVAQFQVSAAASRVFLGAVRAV